MADTVVTHRLIDTVSSGAGSQSASKTGKLSCIPRWITLAQPDLAGPNFHSE